MFISLPGSKNYRHLRGLARLFLFFAFAALGSPVWADGTTPTGDSVISIQQCGETIAAAAAIGARKANDPEVKAFFADILPFSTTLAQNAANLIKSKNYRKTQRGDSGNSAKNDQARFNAAEPGAKLDGEILHSLQFYYEFSMVELASAAQRKAPEYQRLAADALPRMWEQYDQLKALAAKVGSPLGRPLDSFAALRHP